MIKLLNKLPRTLCVAVSGGVDSVACLEFLSRNHNISIAHINHNEGNSDLASDFVSSLAKKYSCPLYYKRVTSNRPKNTSLEEFWRNERYELFNAINLPVVTAHTLDDVVETWVWSSMHGIGKLIPTTNRNVVRPFLTTRKKQFKQYAERNNLAWVEDASNDDTSLTRNYIRKHMMPHVLQVNPGIHKTIRRKIIEENNV